jgi:hypothetical protein
VADDWPSYVAKSIERMLEHVERRWELELGQLATDTEELRTLFGTLADEVDGAGGDVSRQAAEMRSLLAEPSLASRAVEFAELSAENQAHRRVLESLILAFDAEPGATDIAESVRPAIHDYLDRQLARDAELAAPVYMRFGAPK